MSRTRTWKETEKGVARALGGERVSNTALGLRSADVETSAYSVEVKHRKTLPAWLVDAVTQAHRNCAAGKLPLVVLHQCGWRRGNDLVVVQMSEFIEWFGDVRSAWEPVASSHRVQGGAAE